MLLKQRDKKVFQLLRQRGPLCASQLSVELVVPLKEINLSLDELEKKHLVERRSDRDTKRHYTQEEEPWGLATPFHR
ncbi:MAG: helix-turn-helix domain-containing protein [Blastocatellia bacterium]